MYQKLFGEKWSIACEAVLSGPWTCRLSTYRQSKSAEMLLELRYRVSEKETTKQGNDNFMASQVLTVLTSQDSEKSACTQPLHTFNFIVLSNEVKEFETSARQNSTVSLIINRTHEMALINHFVFFLTISLLNQCDSDPQRSFFTFNLLLLILGTFFVIKTKEKS